MVLWFQPPKIKLFQTSVRFLGFDIHHGVIKPIDRAIQFADKFPDQILDKTQLQRFLGSLNYISDFYQNLRQQCKPLFDRLRTIHLLGPQFTLQLSRNSKQYSWFPHPWIFVESEPPCREKRYSNPNPQGSLNSLFRHQVVPVRQRTLLAF